MKPHPFLLVFVLALGTDVVSAAPPTATSIFPAGGQIGTSVEATVTGSFDTWPAKVWTDSKHITVEAAKDKGKFRIAIAKEATPGVCYLRFYDGAGASSLRPFIVGRIPEIEEKEPNDDFRKPQTIVGKSVVVNGRLQKTGDVDCFGAELKKGETLVASLLANRILKSPVDAVMQIVSGDGFVLAQNNDFNDIDPQIAFQAPRDGSYIVRIFAFPAAPDGSIRFFGSDLAIYRLTLTTAGFIDYAWPLAVHFGKASELEFHGWNIAKKDSRLRFEPDRLADIPLTYAGAANFVSIRCMPHECHDYSKLAPEAVLKTPFTLSGRVEPVAQAKPLRFTGKKGQPLLVKVESAELGFPLTPVVRVYDSKEKELAKAEPAALNKDCEAAFNPPADGDYRLEVTDLHRRSGDRFIYRATVAPREPDFDLGVAKDRFALAFGKTLEIPVSIERKNGFSSEIDIAIEGLPEGVKLEIAPVAKKDDKTRTLKVQADSNAFSGPIRIVGTAKESAKRPRQASATITDLEVKASTLWLTIAAEAVEPAVSKKKKN